MVLSLCRVYPLFYHLATCERAVEAENEYYEAVGESVRYESVRCNECDGWHMKKVGEDG